MNPGVPANNFDGYLNYDGITASTNNYVWDVGTLEFVPMSQPIISGGTIVVGAVGQGAAGVDPWLVTGPLTNTQLRASAVPVSLTTDLAPAAPTVAVVGAASAQAVAANASRKGLSLRNVSTGGQRISLGFGNAAVLDSGDTLYPRDVFQMDGFSFDLGAVNAIASGASASLTVQEWAS